jgi:DNA-binding NtrC family response regulator
VEKQKIEKALAEADFNKTRAAQALAISYKTLLNKIKEYGIQPSR